MKFLLLEQGQQKMHTFKEINCKEARGCIAKKSVLSGDIEIGSERKNVAERGWVHLNREREG